MPVEDESEPITSRSDVGLCLVSYTSSMSTSLYAQDPIAASKKQSAPIRERSVVDRERCQKKKVSSASSSGGFGTHAGSIVRA